MSDLYRLVYASKNLIETSEAEASVVIAQILAASRRNNAKVGVTGALLFNKNAFAQVLEGPRRAIENTFERIQRDERHGEVTVLQCGPVESRGFADWSMGFVGRSARGQALWGSLAAESGFDLGRLDGDAVFAMLQRLVLDDEGLITPPDQPPAATTPDRGASELDVARVRAELPRPGQALQAPPHADARRQAFDPVPAPPPLSETAHGSPSALVLAVLKDALAAERQRTTDLRNDLDMMQMALAAGQERMDRLIQERDLWARRAQLLATAIGQEAGAVGGAPDSTMGLEPAIDTPRDETLPQAHSA